jgi:hypothetical protein
MNISEIITYILIPIVGVMFKMMLDTRAALFRDYLPRRDYESSTRRLEDKLDSISGQLKEMSVKIATIGGKKK